MSDADRLGANINAEKLVDALLSEHPLPALAALQPSLSEDLLAVAEAARQRLGADVAQGSPEAELLLVISGHPGLTAVELTARVGPGFREAAQALLAEDLVTSTRFERTDCWSRTARGAQAVRGLSAPGAH